MDSPSLAQDGGASGNPVEGDDSTQLGTIAAGLYQELNRYIKGWVAYYRQCSEEAVRNWKKMDAHVRRRLRAIVIRQKKRPHISTSAAPSRGVSERKAARTAWSSRGIWHRSARSECTFGYRIDWFTEHLVSLTTEWIVPTQPPKLIQPVLGAAACTVCFRANIKEPDA